MNPKLWDSSDLRSPFFIVRFFLVRFLRGSRVQTSPSSASSWS